MRANGTMVETERREGGRVWVTSIWQDDKDEAWFG